MTSLENSPDLRYLLGIFERFYAVPYSSKVPYPEVDLFRIYDTGPFCQPPPPGLFNVKKTPTWLELICECYKAITIDI